MHHLLLIPPHPGVEFIGPLPVDGLLDVGVVDRKLGIRVEQAPDELPRNFLAGVRVGRQGRVAAAAEVGKRLRALRKEATQYCVLICSRALAGSRGFAAV
jgi:hypothetical protein